MPEGWQTALARILDRYTPIVIGYGGNDGSLMGFLKALPAHIPDRVFWCVRSLDVNPTDILNNVPPAVREYVQSRRGRFVPIRGFDELMAKLLTKLGEKGSVPDLYQRLLDRHRARERNYDEQQQRLSAKGTAGDPALAEAVNEIAESRKDKPWWVWVREVDEAVGDDAKEQLYLRALEALPDDAHLHRNYANFLEKKSDHQKAQQYYERSIELDPNEPFTLVSYADFLKWRNAFDKAEVLYQQALDRDPSYDYGLAHYAVFLQDIRKEMDKAEELYQRAIKVNPDYGFALEMYAEFLETVRGNKTKAEELAQRVRQLKSKQSA